MKNFISSIVFALSAVAMSACLDQPPVENTSVAEPDVVLCPECCDTPQCLMNQGGGGGGGGGGEGGGGGGSCGNACTDPVDCPSSNGRCGSCRAAGAGNGMTCQ